FFFSSRRRHTRSDRDWSSDVCSSDLPSPGPRLLSSPLGLEPLDDHGASGSTACPSLTPILLQWYSSACRDGDTAPNLSSRPSNQIGRASCRERAKIQVDSDREKTKMQ